MESFLILNKDCLTGDEYLEPQFFDDTSEYPDRGKREEGQKTLKNNRKQNLIWKSFFCPC
jgi:hypothetical protein